MSELRFRQIHLDFHTSEKIPGVGARFNPQQFQDMLKLGHVDSITLFSKCHHGMTYHDTTVGVRHPHMEEELLPLQIEACRAIDVRTPIYISAGLDEAMIQQHPEWGIKSQDGGTFKPLQAGFKALCFNTPYLDYLCAQIEEVIDLFDGGDGIFLDIIAQRKCFCNWCLRGMQEQGLDPHNHVEVDQYQRGVLDRYYERTTAACRKKNADLRVFHNSGHIAKGDYERMKWNSHLELESLPTGGWGYDHFPVSAKYAATTGYDMLGMTGKFHTTWGEFGGYKRANALRYECAAMLAFGSKCSVGDQLHPDGEMNRDTYDLIGAAYREVEAKEPWCRGAKPVSEIALVSSEALHDRMPRALGAAQLAAHSIYVFGRSAHPEEGAARMLLELQAQFDVVDLDRDLASYRLVVLPDEFVLFDDFATKIKDYLAGGGKLLLSGRSGMTPTHDAFAVDIGLDVFGHSQWDPDYIIPGDKMPTSPVRGRFVIHGGAWDVGATRDDVEVLAGRAEPYFNRTWEHFCSHQHTPDAEPGGFPAVLGSSRMVYFAHDIFTRYRRYGQPLYRDLVQDAINYLLGAASVTTSLPTAGRTALMRQTQENRYLLHLLYGVPTLRGATQGDMARSIEVIEDLVPLHDIECAVRLPEQVQAVRLVPSGEALEFTQEAGAVRFTVPKLLCHQMVELSF